MNIPRNKSVNEDALVDELCEKCLAELKKGRVFSMYWNQISHQIALRVAGAFVEKGYHADEFFVRGRGWSAVNIATYPLGGECESSSSKYYTKTIG